MMHPEHELKQPDIFASELHHWLLLKGPRSRKVRKLMRFARRQPGAELERIFDTKLSEARRWERESRTPTLLNLPTRILEWFCDDAQFIPPREVVLTLIFTATLILGIEYFKVRPINNAWGRVDDSTHQVILPLREAGWSSLRASQGDAIEQVDAWFEQEVSQALDKILESDDFKSKLRHIMMDAIDEAELAIKDRGGDAAPKKGGQLASLEAKEAPNRDEADFGQALAMAKDGPE